MQDAGYGLRGKESGCILRGMDERRSSEGSESRRLEVLYRKAADPVLRTHLLMVWRMSLGEPIGRSPGR